MEAEVQLMPRITSPIQYFNEQITAKYSCSLSQYPIRQIFLLSENRRYYEPSTVGRSLMPTLTVELIHVSLQQMHPFALVPSNEALSW